MGVDYDGVGGVGVKFDTDMQIMAHEKEVFSEADWDDDPEFCLDELGFSYLTAGSAYSGEHTYYLMVDGDTLGDVNGNAKVFCRDLNEKIGSDLSPDKLQIISDLHVW